ncbi:HD domain-containing protein [Ferruginibacter sp.]
MPNKLYMKDFVVALLKDNIPTGYYYHNHEHTLYVLAKAIQIGRHENCNEKEIELMSAAALWHDTGFIRTYAGHEEVSCSFAARYLPEFGFTDEEIAVVCGMIRATKIPQSPKNKLEAIVADADLEYLGTTLAADNAELLFKELQSLTPSLSKAAWNRMQVAFLQQHHYFTHFCKQYREPVKQAYLDELLKAGEEV